MTSAEYQRCSCLPEGPCGSVDSAASKAKANEVAAGVSGVASVIDHLTIKAS